MIKENGNRQLYDHEDSTSKTNDNDDRKHYNFLVPRIIIVRTKERNVMYPNHDNHTLDTFNKANKMENGLVVV